MRVNGRRSSFTPAVTPIAACTLTPMCVGRVAETRPPRGALGAPRTEGNMGGPRGSDPLRRSPDAPSRLAALAPPRVGSLPLGLFDPPPTHAHDEARAAHDAGHLTSTGVNSCR